MRIKPMMAVLSSTLALITTVGGPAPAALASAAHAFTVRAGSLRITLNASGRITSLRDMAHRREYASADHPASLIKLVADGAQQLPTSLSYDTASSTFTFEFGSKHIRVSVQVVPKAGYSTFEVASLKAPAGVDVQTLMWGPITTTITQTVGESVGVVRDSDFAIGIHGLNDKTIGGWPDEFDNLSYPDGPPKVGGSNWPFGWFSASETNWGSILQAYTYDSTKTRYRMVGWPDINEPRVPVPPMSGPDALIKGSKIALFGTEPDNVLNTLSRVETGESLPHPKINGEWEKTSQGASQSFLVLSDISTNTVTAASRYAKQAGIKYIYSLPSADGPWTSAGHYQFDSAFGGSDAGATGLTSTAARNGVKVGVHTLSDFIDTNDPYVAPVPDPGLAIQGSVKLTRPLDAASKTVYVDGDSIFKGGLFNLMRIGNEILNFKSVTPVPGSSTEWQASLISRGMFGTSAAAYPAGATLTRLQGNEYGGFIGGVTMIDRLSSRLAQIFNTTGIKAMSFDGMESASQAGYGTYATNKMINGMYRKLNSTDDFISEASNVVPGTWDAQGRVSWGETCCTPLSVRYDHQAYYRRNYLPDMMGWVSYSPSDSTLDQEWQLSKMASWNAGAGLQASVHALDSSGDTAQVLNAWKQWETARNSHAFSDRQMTEMRDPNTYWHLENVVPGKTWKLYDIEYPAKPLSAPNNGTTSTWQYTNTHTAQPLQFQLHASGGAVTNPSVTIGGNTATFDTTVPADGYLVDDGTATAKLYDHTWHLLGTVTAQGSASFTSGAQSVGYSATGTTGSTSQIRFLTTGAPEQVTARTHHA